MYYKQAYYSPLRNLLLTKMRYLLLNILVIFSSRGTQGNDVTTRLMYDTMAQLVGDSVYPDEW